VCVLFCMRMSKRTRDSSVQSTNTVSCFCSVLLDEKGVSSADDTTLEPWALYCISNEKGAVVINQLASYLDGSLHALLPRSLVR
jgi:hypothetical protein